MLAALSLGLIALGFTMLGVLADLLREREMFREGI
jgi:hypothetical protein